ncbi:MAG: transporter, partial [Mycetocola sp.]|nr:transporter [Mycetocola sp.]
ILGIMTMQVSAVCVWRLLTMVRRGSVFTPAAFRYVDVIIGAIAMASLLTFLLAILLAPGDVAPGIVGLLCGAALVIAGVVLIVLVLRALLTQAVAREIEAQQLRSELNEVI